MPENPEWLPIAQAAQRLGLNERQARRYAGQLPDSCRTVDTSPGGRGWTLIKLDALREYADQAQHRLPGGRGKNGFVGHSPDTGRTSAGQVSDTDAEGQADGEGERPGPLATTIAVAMAVQREGYERAISAQQAQIATLEAALIHERENARHWQEALQREQTLRALSVQYVAAEAVAAEAPEEAAPVQEATPDTQNTPTAPETAPLPPKKTFWQRLVGG